MEETVGPLDLCLPKGEGCSTPGILNGPLNLCVLGKSLQNPTGHKPIADSQPTLSGAFALVHQEKNYLRHIKQEPILEDLPQTSQDDLNMSQTYHKGHLAYVDPESLHVVHSNGDMQVCMICGRQFSTIASLLFHMKGHIDVLECKDCGACFTSELKLNKHCKRNHSSHLLKCSVCCKEFVNLQDLDIHKKTHPEIGFLASQSVNGQYLCNSINLQSYPCYRKKNFKCSDCGKTFARGRNVQIHRNYGRCPAKRDARVVFACSDCGKKFCNEKDLNEHKTEHFIKDGKGFPCQDCGKVFLRKTALHIHTGSRRCTGVQKEERSNNHCPECGIVFKFRAHLVEHMVKHTGERAFQCNGCGKWFARARNVKMHIQRGSCVGGFSSGKVSVESVNN